MGSDRKYRWDKRRERQNLLERNREFRNFWGFEVLLMILIFAIWLIIARLVVVYAIASSPCVEAIVSFGSVGAEMKTTFDIMVSITMLLFGLWLVIGLHYWPVIRRSKSILVHIALFVSIIFLWTQFRMLQVGHNNPPDGSLAIRETVIDPQVSPPAFASIRLRSDEFGQWVLGTDTPFEMPGRYLPQRCVWLDENKILDHNYIVIDGYARASDSQKIELVEAKLSDYNYNAVPWEQQRVGDITRQLVKEMVTDTSVSERLIRKQSYRELLPEERERFLKKQECLRSNFATLNQHKKCTFFWHTDWDSFYEKLALQ